MVQFPVSSVPVFFDMLMRNDINQFTPYGYQRILTNCVEKYFKTSGQNIDVMFEKGLALIYVGDTIEIFKTPEPTDNITCDIWHSGFEGAAARYEMRYHFDDGTTAFICTFYFVVLDVNSRHVISNPTHVVDFNYFQKGEKLIESHSRISLDYSNFVFAENVLIRPSWIDAVGHMDNVRYLELSYDVLSPDQRHNMNHLKRFEIYFHRELIEGDVLTLKKLVENDKTYIAGFKEDSVAVFTLKLIFEN